MKTEDQAQGNNRDRVTETAGRTQTVGVTGETHQGNIPAGKTQGGLLQDKRRTNKTTVQTLTNVTVV